MTKNNGIRESIIVVIAILFFSLWFLEKNRPAIVSPLSDSSTVYASELIPPISTQIQWIDFLRALAGRNFHVLEKIAWCESGFWPEAVNQQTKDYGIFQINLESHRNRIPGKTDEEKISWLKNPYNNIMFGYTLFLEQGISPWNSSYNCWND